MKKIVHEALNPQLFIFFTTSLLMLANIGKTDGSKGGQSMKWTLNPGMDLPMDQNRNGSDFRFAKSVVSVAAPSERTQKGRCYLCEYKLKLALHILANPLPLLLRRVKRTEDTSRDQHESGNHCDLTIQEKDGEIIRLRKELEESGKLVKEKSRMVAKLHGELKRKADLMKAKCFKDETGNSQLHLAVQSGDEKVVKELIQLGADVHARNYNSETPIVMASARRADCNVTLSIVNYLIQRGANVTKTEWEAVAFPRNCEHIQMACITLSGIYTIFPFESKKDVPVKVYCDLETEGGGWTVFQRRTPPISGKVDFERTWREYADGFHGSSMAESHWLGLNAIAELTKAGDTELRIDMTDWDNAARFAKYDWFQVSNETEKFKLVVGDYSGDAGDSLAHQNEISFSTKDRDNDASSSTSCAQTYRGAWWYKDCCDSNLNGVYVENGINTAAIIWKGWHGRGYSLKTTEMKLRSVSYKGVGPGGHVKWQAPFIRFPPGQCLKKGTKILMADMSEKPVESVQAGDLIMDVDFKPTKVLGSGSEFLLDHKFYGFRSDSPFFTGGHLFVGPSKQKDELNIYAQSLSEVYRFNPLMEYLNITEFNGKRGTSIFHLKQEEESLDTKIVEVFEEPMSHPQDTLVHFLIVDSPTGTYFANGYVCRHDIPPFEIWPNTMGLLFGLAETPTFKRFAKVPYELETIPYIHRITDTVTETVQSYLARQDWNEGGTENQPASPVMALSDIKLEDALSNIFDHPTVGLVGNMLYAKVGKVMSSYLDSEAHKEQNCIRKDLGRIQHELLEIMIAELEKGFTV